MGQVRRIPVLMQKLPNLRRQLFRLLQLNCKLYAPQKQRIGRRGGIFRNRLPGRNHFPPETRLNILLRLCEFYLLRIQPLYDFI